MTDQQRAALWAKQEQIEAAARVAWARLERGGAGLAPLLDRVERLRAEYDTLFAASRS
jgi:hypothetical protein